MGYYDKSTQGNRTSRVMNLALALAGVLVGGFIGYWWGSVSASTPAAATAARPVILSTATGTQVVKQQPSPLINPKAVTIPPGHAHVMQLLFQQFRIDEPGAVITVFQSRTPIPFFMYGCNGCSSGMMRDIQHHGIWSPVETVLFHTILNNHCRNPDGSSRLVVDVGANAGFFTLLAATYGCRVLSFEPVVGPRMLLTASVALNNFTSQVTIKDIALSGKTGEGTGVGGYDLTHIVEKQRALQQYQEYQLRGLEPRMRVSQNWQGNWMPQMWKNFGAGAAANQNFGQPTFKMTLDTMARVVTEDVILMKVDTEGHEASVMAGAADYFKNHNVEAILMEVKEANSEVKRKMLQSMMQMGKMVKAYNFLDHDWSRSHGRGVLDFVQIPEVCKDVTQIIVSLDLNTPVHYEDFILVKKPLY